MNRMQKQVRAFHKTVTGQPTSPAEPELRDAELRARLIAEEAAETVYALVGGEKAFKILHEYAYPHPHHIEYQRVGGKPPDLVEVIDGLCDILYVTLGTAEAIGVDIEPFMDEVHDSNMAKVGPYGVCKSENGKILKPSSWRPPDIAGVLARIKEETYDE